MKKEELISELYALLNESPESVAERERTAHDKLTKSFKNRLILFGTGKLGRRTLKGLREVGIEPLAFCDNNSVIWGSDIEGLKVLSPEKAVSEFGANAAFVVTIWNNTLGHPLEVVRQQLQSYGNCAVVSFLPLYWKYHRQFLPYFSLGLPRNIITKKAEVIEFAEILSDSYSRACYLAHIDFRLKGDFRILMNPIDGAQYFVKELLNNLSEEVFIDCGAFNGDTLREFLRFTGNKFLKYFAVEPDTKNSRQLLDYIHSLDSTIQNKIEVSHFCASKFEGKVKFNNSGAIDSSISKSGDIEIACTRLDSLIKCNKPTFLKIDIEGGEADDINGGQGMISQHNPTLAIAAYHRPNDIWSLGCDIKKINPNYLFYLRAHAFGGWENILYAVPHCRLPT